MFERLGRQITRALPDYESEEDMHKMHRVKSYAEIMEKMIGEDNYEKVQPNEELRCIVAIVRHGDRTPKQKIKATVYQVNYTEKVSMNSSYLCH